jgi:hypothetical protein
MRSLRDLPPLEVIRSFEVAGQATEAIGRLPGVRWSRLCLSKGNLVFVSDLENYGVADAALADEQIQEVFASLGAQFGYRTTDDEFLLDVDQAMPFLKG